MKIIIRNRRNYEDKQELTISEFKIKFSKELSSALQIYTNNRSVSYSCLLLCQLVNYTTFFEKLNAYEITFIKLLLKPFGILTIT